MSHSGLATKISIKDVPYTFFRQKFFKLAVMISYIVIDVKIKKGVTDMILMLQCAKVPNVQSINHVFLFKKRV